jgi:hypothetical protein
MLGATAAIRAYRWPCVSRANDGEPATDMHREFQPGGRCITGAAIAVDGCFAA